MLLIRLIGRTSSLRPYAKAHTLLASPISFIYLPTTLCAQITLS